jgi:acetoin utilization protein AcuB
MLVREVMTPNPITVRPDSDYLAAIALMRAGKFRRLPVVDDAGHLVGLVSNLDLHNASLGQPTQETVTGDGVLVRVREVMKRHVVTVSPDYPFEEAARLMVEHKIGSLPVVEEGRLVGILTDTDVFQQLVAILGGGSQTVRLTIQLDNQPGQLAALAERIASVGGNILSIASFPAETPRRMNFTVRVESVPPESLQAAIESHAGAQVVNIWRSSG